MQNKQLEQQNNIISMQGGDPSPPLFYVTSVGAFPYIYFSTYKKFLCFEEYI